MDIKPREPVSLTNGSVSYFLSILTQQIFVLEIPAVCLLIIKIQLAITVLRMELKDPWIWLRNYLTLSLYCSES